MKRGVRPLSYLHIRSKPAHQPHKSKHGSMPFLPFNAKSDNFTRTELKINYFKIAQLTKR